MKSIEFNEYGKKVCACFRPNAPMCPAQAVIPTLTVENKQGIKGLTNCLVRVADINTTYYIDEKGRIAQTWAGPIVEDNYDYDNNPLDLRDQLVYDFAREFLIIYDASGRYQIFKQRGIDFDSLVNRPKYAGVEMTSETNIPDINGTVSAHNNDNNAHGTIQNRITAVETSITRLDEDIDDIKEVIPNQATSSNQLADKAFVNSTVQTGTANFRGNWTTWSNVPTDPTLYPVDYAGETTPSTNDYMVVQDASGYTEETLEGTWRFKYGGLWATDGKSGWYPEYQVNETPMTAVQLAALNSGATTALISQISINESDIDDLQATFVGTDGTVAGANGLVPAPSTTDVGKFLNADGYWGEAVTPTALNTRLGGLTFITLTQAEYDALPAHDINTLYVIKAN